MLDHLALLLPFFFVLGTMQVMAPAGFPRGAWAAATPTPTAASGTFTTVSAATRALRVGKTLFFAGSVTDTTNGTAAGYIRVPLPAGMTVGALSQVGAGRNGSTGAMLQVLGQAGDTAVLILDYAGVYPIASGQTVFFSIALELA